MESPLAGREGVLYSRPRVYVVYMYVRVCVYTYIYSIFSVIEKVFRLKSTGKRKGKRKKTAKIYGLIVVLLPMDIIMKKDSEVEKRGPLLNVS